VVVRQLIANNFAFRETTPLSETGSLVGSGLIDSTGVLELVLLLEKAFSVRIGNDEVVPDNLDTISRIVAFVERKLGVAAETVAHAS
jgi:acyl carrier protein